MDESNKKRPNDLLKQERLLRGWTQQDVAEKFGVDDSKLVSAWERGVKQPGPHNRQMLCELFGKTPIELGLLQEVDASTQRANRPLSSQEQRFPPVWNVPERNLLFTGRDEILHRLHRSLLAQETAVLTQTLSGLGGVGKTQIAIEYCYQYRGEYQAVLWVGADSPETVSADLLEVARLLKFPVHVTRNQQQILGTLQAWMRTQARWLLVLDNVEDLKTIKTIVPSARRGHVLLTMRSQLTGTYPKIDVVDLPEEEGALLLLRRANFLAPGDSLQSASETDQEAARLLSRTLGGLPLALDQAGAYIQETGCGLSEYLEQYQVRRAEFLSYRGEFDAGYPESVATTWSLSFEKVRAANVAAADILYAAAFLHPDVIPEELFLQGAKALGPSLWSLTQQGVSLDRLFKELLRYSLIRRKPLEKTLSVHRLVQAVIVDSMDQKTQRLWAERVVKAVDSQLLEDMAKEQSDQLYARQTLTCLQMVNHWKFTFLEAVQILNAAGKYLYKDGYYAKAEALCSKALDMLPSTAGASLTDTYLCLMTLVAIKTDGGALREAEIFCTQWLATSEKAFGPRHPQTTYCLYTLAHIYIKRGKYEQAELLLARALEVYQVMPLSLSIPPAIDARVDLAKIFSHQGRRTEAEALYHEVLMTTEQFFGSSHPKVGDVLTELAIHCASHKDLVAAVAHRTRALTIYTKAYPPDHPDIAIAYSGLSQDYFDQGCYSEADDYYERAKHLWRGLHQTNVPDEGVPEGSFPGSGAFSERKAKLPFFLNHLDPSADPERGRDIATVANKLADSYRAQQRDAEAEEILWYALDLSEKTRGKKDLVTVYCLGNCARFFQIRKANILAEFLYERAIRISIAEFQLEPAGTLQIAENYTQFCRETGREHAAVGLEEEIVRWKNKRGGDGL